MSLLYLGNTNYSPVIPQAPDAACNGGLSGMNLIYNILSYYCACICIYIDDIMTATPDVWLVVSIVIPKIKAKWDHVAFSMGYSISAVKSFRRDAQNIEEACLNFLGDWLESNNGATPKTWGTLLDRVKAVDSLYAEAENIKTAIIMKLTNTNSNSA